MTNLAKSLLLGITVIVDLVEFLADPIMLGAGLLLSIYYVEVQMLTSATLPY